MVLHKLIYILVLLPFLLYAQKTEYGWPAKANRIITGSFGEFRYYYFHLGMDFTTNGVINTPILAITDGKVVKIMMNRYSIGNAVFLEHTDGLTSKYGHLNSFSNKIIQSLPEDIQKKVEQRKDFEYVLEKPVSFVKGETIALSGETGIGPPHLHLEIFKDGIYYNPAIFGINHNPNGKITLFSLFIRPYNYKSFINGKNTGLYIPLKQVNPNLFIPVNNTPVKIQGRVFFQIEGNELSGPVNKLGFQKIGIYLNDKLKQEISMDVIKRSHILRSCLVMDNYRSKMNGKPFSYFIHTKYENGLLGYKNKSKGKGTITDSMLLHEVENEVKIQTVGLSSTANAKVILLRDYSDYSNEIVKSKPDNVVPGKHSSLLSEDQKMELYFPAHSVFSTVNFELKKVNIYVNTPDIKVLSNVYGVYPYFKEFNLGYNFYLYSEIIEDLSKVDVYRVSDSGRILSSLGAKYFEKQKFFKKNRIRYGGNFVVLADYSKPQISMYKYKNNTVFTNKSFKLNLKVYDTGSGVGHEDLKVKIDSIDSYVDYDPQKGLREIFAPVDIIYSAGKHKIEAIATDKAGNVSDTFTFEYEVKN